MATAEPTSRGAVRRRMAAPDGRLPATLLALFSLAGLALILYATWDFVLYADDWAILQQRYDGGVDSLLDPYNGHLMAVPILIFKVLARTAGLDVHWPYMTPLIIGHLIAVAGVFAIARKRIGAWPALCLVAPLVVLGAAWESLLWPASINFVLFTMGSVLAWLALDRGDRKGDVAALLFTLLATFSSGAAICLHLALAAELLFAKRYRALWVPGIPALLFIVWLVAYGDGGSATFGTIAGAPGFAAEMAATATAGLLGQSSAWGYTLVVLLLGAAAYLLVTRPATLTPRHVGVTVALLAFWALTGAVRGGQTGASSSRYVEVGAVYLAILLAELGRHIRWDRRVVVALAAFAAIGMLGNLSLLHYGVGKFGALNEEVSARVGAFDLAPQRADANYVLAPGIGYAPVAEPYRKLMRLTGEQGGRSPAEINELGAGSRAAADVVLNDVAVIKEPVARAASCAPAPTEEQELAQGEPLIVRAGAGEGAVVLRRFGERGSGVRIPVPANTALSVRTVRDRAPEQPYRVRIEGAGAQRCERGV